jgi:hypothetical protein
MSQQLMLSDSQIEGNPFNSIAMKLAANDNFSGCTNGYRAMLETEFAAPVLRGRPVTVVVDEDHRRVQIVPPMFQGWAVARLISPSTAIVIREADDVERDALLAQWPEASLQVCHVSALGVLAVRLTHETPSSVVRVHLCDDAVASNDIVRARFDGRQYWFDRIIARTGDAKLLCFSSTECRLPDLCTATFATSFPLNDEPVH